MLYHKNMKSKYLYGLIITILLIAFFLIVAKEFPKNVSRLPFFFVLILLDTYLWFYIRRRIKKWSKPWKVLIGWFYWLSFILIMGMVFVSFIISYNEWDKVLKIYLGGVIFVFYAAKIFPIITMIIDDIRRLFILLYRGIQKIFVRGSDFQGKKISRSKFLNDLGLITGGIALSGLIIGMVKWVHDFQVRRNTIKLKSLPASFQGLRIVQISDLHLGSWTEKKKLVEVVDLINDLDPDLVFFTGDLVDYISAEAYDYTNVLEKISSKMGVFAVLGNHDYGDYSTWNSESEKSANMEELYAFFKNVGWKLLKNENYIIEQSGERIAIIGIENWSSYDRFPKYGDLEKALSGTEDVQTKLLLSHDPTFWEEHVQKRYPQIDITFSGHTHGFQFGVELKNFKWSPAQYLYKHWAGLYSNVDGGRDQYLYVNRGTGTIGYPGRIGILPEISVFELL
jgi:predicted MPP superfamily phosphohydrolase